MTSAAFAPLAWWPAAFLGPTMLLAVVRGMRPAAAAVSGSVFALFFFGPLLWWMTNVGVLPWAVLVVAQAVLFGAMTAAVPLLAGLPWWPVWAACWWVSAEGVRSRVPLGGFPWGRLAFSQTDSPALGFAALGGAPAVSAVVAVMAACVAHLATCPTARQRWRAGAGLAAACVAVAAGPVFALGAGLAPKASVAVVQGNVPRERSMAEQARVTQVSEHHVAATLRLAADIAAGRTKRPDLVIWPENATDRDPRTDPALAAGISRAARAVGVPIVVGAILDGPRGTSLNTALLWDPLKGPGRYYTKRQLVPFGEYIPARSLLGGLGDLQLIPRDFTAGTAPIRLDAGPVRLGVSICYEVAYDGQVRDQTMTGANLLAVPSNNSTYMRDGNLAEPGQQMAMARLRAVEHHRAVAVASSTGISALIDARGRLIATTGSWRRQVLTADLPLYSDTTTADRIGAAPEAAAGATVLTALAAGAWRRRRPPAAGTRDAVLPLPSPPPAVMARLPQPVARPFGGNRVIRRPGRPTRLQSYRQHRGKGEGPPPPTRGRSGWTHSCVRGWRRR